jgi:hypothetical protein
MLRHPMYATGIGLVLRGFDEQASGRTAEPAGVGFRPGGKRIGGLLRDFWERSRSWWIEDTDAEEFTEH